MKGQIKSRITGSRTDWHGRTFPHMVKVKGVKENTSIHPDQPRASSPINDNYCVDKLQEGLLAGSQDSTPRQTMNTLLNTNANFHVVKVVHTASGLSQRK